MATVSLLYVQCMHTCMYAQRALCIGLLRQNSGADRAGRSVLLGMVSHGVPIPIRSLNGISYIHTLCAICLLRCMCRARSSAVLVAYVICAKLSWSLPYSHFLEACRDSKRNETKRPLGLTSPLSLLDCQATLFSSTALVCFLGGGEKAQMTTFSGWWAAGCSGDGGILGGK